MQKTTEELHYTKKFVKKILKLKTKIKIEETQTEFRKVRETKYILCSFYRYQESF